jgi:hypothetical protein
MFGFIAFVIHEELTVWLKWHSSLTIVNDPSAERMRYALHCGFWPCEEGPV